MKWGEFLKQKKRYTQNHSSRLDHCTFKGQKEIQDGLHVRGQKILSEG